MVKTESIGFSVTLFAVFALLTITILMLRRTMKVFGQAELGGAKIPKIVCSIILSSFWVIYVILSSLQAQGVMNVGF